MNKTSLSNNSEIKISKPEYLKLFWATLFAIAMGMLECAVVIYIRELYYPDGFRFPVRATSDTVTVTELLRELATVIMLLGIGMVAGKNKQERFAWFIYCFAIWDIFYYVFLYLIIGWPVSFLDWDVLFLVPIMWVGPVWAPIELSLLMIVLSLSILYFSGKRASSSLKLSEWFALISGSLIVIVAFCKEYFLFMTRQHPTIPKTELFFSKQTFAYAAQYVPVNFDVWIFFLGCLVICIGIGLYLFRNFSGR
jgi:hypothetical protein